jgi:LacI family transcriptional regulator
VKEQKHKADIVAVAKAANVSISTVSRSFNHPDLVKPATRRKIDKAVKRLGYIRNRAAQAMHGRRSGTIGLVVPTIDHAIFAEVVQAFSDALDEEGFTILMATHGFDLAREYAVMRKLFEHRVDGVALIGMDHSEATYQLIQQQDIPSLAIWNYDEHSVISCVGVQNFAAGEMAAQHLLVQGHRDIGLIFPDTSENDRARHRLVGAQRVLTAQGVTVRPEWQIEAPYSVAEAKRACLDLLSLRARPSAILCGNDVIAQGAIFAAHRLGLRVPQDISVIGIGDFPGSAEMEPPLTTIRIPAKRLGRSAAKLLAKNVISDEKGVFRQKLDLQLLVRGTTAPFPPN